MPDIIDDANELVEKLREAAIEKARQAAADIPVGNPGDCDLCGEYSGRLVKGVCAPCRTRYKLE